MRCNVCSAKYVLLVLYDIHINNINIYQDLTQTECGYPILTCYLTKFNFNF